METVIKSEVIEGLYCRYQLNEEKLSYVSLPSEAWTIINLMREEPLTVEALSARSCLSYPFIERFIQGLQSIGIVDKLDAPCQMLAEQKGDTEILSEEDSCLDSESVTLSFEEVESEDEVTVISID